MDSNTERRAWEPGGSVLETDAEDEGGGVEGTSWGWGSVETNGFIVGSSREEGEALSDDLSGRRSHDRGMQNL